MLNGGAGGKVGGGGDGGMVGGYVMLEPLMRGGDGGVIGGGGAERVRTASASVLELEESGRRRAGTTAPAN